MKLCPVHGVQFYRGFCQFCAVTDYNEQLFGEDLAAQLYPPYRARGHVLEDPNSLRRFVQQQRLS